MTKENGLFGDIKETEEIRSSTEDEQKVQLARRSQKEKIRDKGRLYIIFHNRANGRKPDNREGGDGKPAEENWIEAMNQEYEALQRNKTWEYVKQLKDKKLLTTKWIFKIKHSEKEKPRYKARLVVRGCAQTQGIYYYETYSPVVRYTTIRYLLALAAKENLEISHMDVTAAYLNSDLEEDIYVRPPEEYKNIQPKSKIWKLKKAVYSLKQNGRSWNKRLDEILKD